MMISYEFPNKRVPSSGKGGWVDPIWDKVLNSTNLFLRQAKHHFSYKISYKPTKNENTKNYELFKAKTANFLPLAPLEILLK